MRLVTPLAVQHLLDIGVNANLNLLVEQKQVYIFWAFRVICLHQYPR
jgi:hypothetical protein